MSRAASPRSTRCEALWAAAGHDRRCARRGRPDRRRRARRAASPPTSPRAIAQAGPRAAMLLHRAADAALMGWPAIAAIPPVTRRYGRRLCRAGPQLPAARRALPRKPPRPSDVRQARGAAVRHRRADPPDHASPRPSTSSNSASPRWPPPATARSPSRSSPARSTRSRIGAGSAAPSLDSASSRAR